MTQQELFEQACKAYTSLANFIDQSYAAIFSQIDSYDKTYKQTMVELDVYLQGIFLKVALADKNFTIEEAVYIQKITDYGDMFNSIDLADAAGSDDCVEMLDKIATDTINDVPECMKILGSFDDFDKEHNILKLFFGLFCAMTAAIAAIDGRVVESESKIAIQAMMPMLAFFPKDSIQTLKD